MRGLLLACVMLLSAATPCRAGDVIPARPELTLLRAIDLPWVDKALVVYLWRSDRPLELRWSTGDVEQAPGRHTIRVRLLGRALDSDGGYVWLTAEARELGGAAVAGWGWAWPAGLPGPVWP